MAAKTLEGAVGEVLRGTVAKHGNTDEECQDASDVRTDPDGRVRIALADGATQGSGQALWAGLLVKAAAERSPAASTLREWLAPVRQEWSRLRAGAPVSANAPWFASHTRLRGAGSTLLCVELERRGESLHWSAAAVGDTCVQVVSRSERRLVRSFPVERAEDFGVRPELLYTDGEAEVVALAVAEGVLAPGDLLITATDAVAKGLLADPRLVEEIADLDSDEAIVAFLQGLKQGERVEDDDLTVTLVRAAAAPSTPVRTRAVERPRPTRQSDRDAKPVAVTPPTQGRRAAEAVEHAAPGPSRPRGANAQTRGRQDAVREGVRARRGRRGGVLSHALVTIVILALHDLGWYILCSPARDDGPAGPRAVAAPTVNPPNVVTPVRSDTPPQPPPQPRVQPASDPGVVPPKAAEERSEPSVVSAEAVNATSDAPAKPEASVAEEYDWMCCRDEDNCKVQGNFVVMEKAGVRRDANGKKRESGVSPGKHEQFNTRDGASPPEGWKDNFGCEQHNTWVKLQAEKNLSVRVVSNQ